MQWVTRHARQVHISDMHSRRHTLRPTATCRRPVPLLPSALALETRTLLGLLLLHDLRAISPTIDTQHTRPAVRVCEDRCHTCRICSNSVGMCSSSALMQLSMLSRRLKMLDTHGFPTLASGARALMARKAHRKCRSQLRSCCSTPIKRRFRRLHLLPGRDPLVAPHIAPEAVRHRHGRQGLLPQLVQRLRRVLLPPCRVRLPPQLLIQSLHGVGHCASAAAPSGPITRAFSVL